MTGSVWEALAKLAPEDREKYIKTAPNRAKITKTGVKSAVYQRTVIEGPNGGPLVWHDANFNKDDD